MKNHIITARINDFLLAEIEFLKTSLKLPSTTSVMRFAIHSLYVSVKAQESQKSSLEMLEENGLIGCFEGPTDLSQSIKLSMAEVIEKKHAEACDPHKKLRSRKTGKK